jgi:hypothetical protein
MSVQPGRHAAPEQRGGAEEEEPLPSFSEQMSEQLGGVRGLIESSIPITVFVILNFLAERFDWWPLRTTLIVACAVAVLIAGYRLARREPVRHAINGLFGIGLGAYIAYRSGEARGFYLPGILYTGGYALVLFLTAAARWPLVGWLWSVMFDGGKPRWRQDGALRRAFTWLTLLWSVTYLVKFLIQGGLYLAEQTDLLGASRLILGWPLYALLLAVTVWSVRSVTRKQRALAEA